MKRLAIFSPIFLELLVSHATGYHVEYQNHGFPKLARDFVHDAAAEHVLVIDPGQEDDHVADRHRYDCVLFNSGVAVD